MMQGTAVEVEGKALRVTCMELAFSRREVRDEWEGVSGNRAEPREAKPMGAVRASGAPSGAVPGSGEPAICGGCGGRGGERVREMI